MTSKRRPRDASLSSALTASPVMVSILAGSRPESSKLRRARACTLAARSTATTARAHRRLGRPLTGQRPHPSLLVNPARLRRRFDGVVELLAPRQRAGRQPLDDDEVAVAIDGDAGQALALAGVEAHRRRHRLTG